MLASGDHRRRQVMRAGHDVGDELGFGRIGHRRFEHADNRRRARVEANRLADHRRIALERRRPEPVGQHRGAGRARPVVAGVSRRPRTGRSPITSK